MAPVSHITISPADKEKIYATVVMLIRRMREHAAAADVASESLQADILEQVVRLGQSNINEVARQLGLKPDDELFTEQWQWAAELVAEQTRLA